MAFGKHMEMMGGKSKLKPEPKDKPEEKSEDKKESKGDDKPEHDGKKHFHVSHDGLSYQSQGTNEDGSQDEPMEHGSTDEVKGHMDQFFGDGDGDEQQMPVHHAEPMMGGYGG
jgi:hypothetical protein